MHNGRSGEVNMLGEPPDLVMKEGHLEDDGDDYLNDDQSDESEYDSNYSDENADAGVDDEMEGIVHDED